MITASTDKLRSEIREIVNKCDGDLSKARRIYFDRSSYALADKHQIEFEIKSAVADRYRVPFRSVVFTGSAQLGFSPHKDTEFKQGTSDLDVACVDNGLYQIFWEEINETTRAFKDESGFSSEFQKNRLKCSILQRGMILLDAMPTCALKRYEKQFFDRLSVTYRSVFGSITLAVYMNERAFCLKQLSAIQRI